VPGLFFPCLVTVMIPTWKWVDENESAHRYRAFIGKYLPSFNEISLSQVFQAFREGAENVRDEVFNLLEGLDFYGFEAGPIASNMTV